MFTKNKFLELVDAINHGKFETVNQILGDNPELISQKSSFGVTPLMRAAVKGHFEVAKLLIAKGSHVDEKDNYNSTALMRAAGKGYVEVADHLIEEQSHVNAKNTYDQTALRYEADQGHLEVAKLLIENGSDVNAKNIRGQTALMRAADKGHLEVAKLLVANGSDVNAKNIYGETALMLAADKGHLKVARHLIANGSDVNAKDSKGMTALMRAADQGHLEVAKLLIENGSDFFVKKTALDYAEHRYQFLRPMTPAMVGDTTTTDQQHANSIARMGKLIEFLKSHIAGQAERFNKIYCALCLGKGAEMSELGPEEKLKKGYQYFSEAFLFHGNPSVHQRYVTFWQAYQYFKQYWFHKEDASQNEALFNSLYECCKNMKYEPFGFRFFQGGENPYETLPLCRAGSRRDKMAQALFGEDYREKLSPKAGGTTYAIFDMQNKAYEMRPLKRSNEDAPAAQGD